MIQKILGFSQRYMQKPWYPVLVGFLVAVDIFILISPNDVLLVSAVLAQPKRWFGISVLISIACIIGVAAFCAILLHDPDYIRASFPSVFQSSIWSDTSRFLQHYGIFALFLGAAGPFPQQPFVVVAALSGMKLPTLLLSVFTGRLVKYLFLAWIASHSPKLLAKFIQRRTVSKGT